MVANSDVVRARLELVLPVAHLATVALCEHPDVRALYPELLRLEHCTIRASVPLLRTAEQEATRRAASGDRVAHEVTPYLRRHAREQLHHDDWLLDDYAALDLDPVDVLERPPPPTVAAMVGAIYYWILHYHPVVIIGHLAVLAGALTTPALIDELQRRIGHPPAAFQTLAHHAEMDPDHAAELWELLDRLPLTAPQLAVITTAALHTFDHYVAALDELVNERLS